MDRCVRICTLLLGVALLAGPAYFPAGASAKHHGHARKKHHRVAPPHRPSASFLRGVTISDSASEVEVAGEIAEAHKLHAQVVRLEASWSSLQPSAPGQFSPTALATVDHVVRLAVAHGERVILLIQGTPCWASSAPASIERSCVPGHSGAASSWPPLNPSDFGAFAAALARRYGVALAALEIWNEPDYSGEQYLAGPNKPEHYAALLKAAYPAVKAVDPTLPVLAGAIVGPNGAFLDALYADGIKGYYDGLAVHFYTLTAASLHAIREVQEQNGDFTPVWLDEFGWPSCWPHGLTQAEQACVPPAVQAANLVNMTRTLAATPYVAAEVFYKFHDTPGEEFGVLATNGARKPSFAAVAGVFAAPFGAASPVALGLRRAHGGVLASGSGPVGEYMELEVLKRGVPRWQTIFTLDRFDDYSIPLPSFLGTRHLTVRVWQYWKGRSSAVKRSI
jgi:hypothetical protein